MKIQSLNHLYAFFICALFTLPAMAQCLEGRSEVLLMTPSGISKTICLPDEAIPGIENAADHSDGLIQTIVDYPQFDPIVNAYPDENLVIGHITGIRWPYVLAPNVEPIDDVFLSACTQVNNLDASAVNWFPSNYKLFAGPVPALCVDITLWDQTTVIISNVGDNPITDPMGLGRDCGVSLGCHPEQQCQVGFEWVPCCRMAVKCIDPQLDPQEGNFSTFAADYHF